MDKIQTNILMWYIFGSFWIILYGKPNVFLISLAESQRFYLSVGKNIFVKLEALKITMSGCVENSKYMRDHMFLAYIGSCYMVNLMYFLSGLRRVEDSIVVLAKYICRNRSLKIAISWCCQSSRHVRDHISGQV